MYKLLFVCTHNRCRSILSEAITNHYCQGILIARSAGSQPCGKVHPLSLQYLAEAGIKTKYLRSQPMSDFDHFDPDVVITVCSSADKEICPVWLGDSFKLHWELSDPSKSYQSNSQSEKAFHSSMHEIKARTDLICKLAKKNLPINDFKNQMLILAS